MSYLDYKNENYKSGILLHIDLSYILTMQMKHPIDIKKDVCILPSKLLEINLYYYKQNSKGRITHINYQHPFFIPLLMLNCLLDNIDQHKPTNFQSIGYWKVDKYPYWKQIDIILIHFYLNCMESFNIQTKTYINANYIFNGFLNWRKNYEEYIKNLKYNNYYDNLEVKQIGYIGTSLNNNDNDDNNNSN